MTPIRTMQSSTAVFAASSADSVISRPCACSPLPSSDAESIAPRGRRDVPTRFVENRLSKSVDDPDQQQPEPDSIQHCLPLWSTTGQPQKVSSPGVLSPVQIDSVTGRAAQDRRLRRDRHSVRVPNRILLVAIGSLPMPPPTTFRGRHYLVARRASSVCAPISTMYVRSDRPSGAGRHDAAVLGEIWVVMPH